jgi:hypothetical protein
VPSTPPSLLSIDCSLAALQARLNGEMQLGTFAPKLLQTVEKARAKVVSATTLCEAADVKKTLDPAVRQRYVDAGVTIQRDLKSLRDAVICSAG